VGLDKIQKPLHFSVASGLYFFCLQFSFHTTGYSAFFLVAVFGGQVGLLHFQQTVLNSYLALQYLLFIAAVFGAQC
jgi:hypothetical protein